MANIKLQKWGFIIELDDPPETDAIHNALFAVEGVIEVEGPCINGTVGVYIWSKLYRKPELAEAALVNALESIGVDFHL